MDSIDTQNFSSTSNDDAAINFLFPAPAGPTSSNWERTKQKAESRGRRPTVARILFPSGPSATSTPKHQTVRGRAAPVAAVTNTIDETTIISIPEASTILDAVVTAAGIPNNNNIMDNNATSLIESSQSVVAYADNDSTMLPQQQQQQPLQPITPGYLSVIRLEQLSLTSLFGLDYSRLRLKVPTTYMTGSICNIAGGNWLYATEPQTNFHRLPNKFRQEESLLCLHDSKLGIALQILQDQCVAILSGGMNNIEQHGQRFNFNADGNFFKFANDFSIFDINGSPISSEAFNWPVEQQHCTVRFLLEVFGLYLYVQDNQRKIKLIVKAKQMRVVSRSDSVISIGCLL